MAEPALQVAVAHDPLDVAGELARFTAAAGPAAGGIGCFVGTVRGGDVTALELEHYPGMTERRMAEIAREACARFDLAACTVVHRVGRLAPTEPIVLVLAAARHRGEALDATRFLIDWLKTRAPFWKREHRADGSAAWVEARASDEDAAAGWEAAAAAR